MTDELTRAEGYMVQGQDEAARDLLSRLAEDAEEYVDRNCPVTDELQWFSFPTLFDRLAYRRVENDPRELRDVGEPLDRLYADLALACVHTGDYEMAAASLRQAVRWNPMACEHRLNLADLCRIAGDMNECLALTYSVFERASQPGHLARAYVTFSQYFQVSKKPKAAAAALRAARRLDVNESALAVALDQAAGGECDPDGVGDDEVEGLLAAEGLPEGANADLAICMLMCAVDYARMGQGDEATRLTLRARDLVGEQAAMALMQLIRSDEDEVDDANAS